jgi:hypothetical protein
MKGQQLLVLSLLKNTFSYRLIRGYSYQLSPTDTISLIRKIVSFWYRLLRTDTQINFQKKILNLDLSPPGANPSFKEGGHHRPRREGGGAIGRRCRSRLRHRGLPSAQIRPYHHRIPIGSSPQWGWECLLQLLKVWLHAHPPWRKAVVVERRR